MTYVYGAASGVRRGVKGTDKPIHGRSRDNWMLAGADENETGRGEVDRIALM